MGDTLGYRHTAREKPWFLMDKSQYGAGIIQLPISNGGPEQKIGLRTMVRTRFVGYPTYEKMVWLLTTFRNVGWSSK